MAAAAPGDWDRLVIVQPNASAEDVNAVLGFEWDGSGAASDRVAGRNVPGVLLFVAGEEVQHSADFDARDLYLKCTDGSEFARGEAAFTALQSDELAPGPALVQSGTAPEPHCRRVFGQ